MSWKLRLARWFVAPMLIASFITLPIGKVLAQDNYNFGSEQINYGYSANPSNKNAEDAAYNTLTEQDRYTDTNYSGSSENVVTGTTGGGSFPSALDTDDGTRRNYIEANTGGGSPTYQVLRPTSDGDVTTMVEFPTSPTTHYDKVDETTAGGDGDTTYLEGVTNAQESELGMADPSDPGGSPNIDVTMWQISRGETTSACTVVWGIEIGGVEYQGGSTTMTSDVYANYSYEWTVDPSDSLEWTLTDVNGLETYIRVTDANPDTRTTQIGLLVEFNPAASYQLDAQITYSSVTSSSQTTGFQVFAQGYRNGDTESVKIQAWNYTSSAWVDKATISTGSDADYNFDLLGWAANCERSSGNVVLLRLVDASNGDATQTTAYLDVLKVNRIEKGYDLDIELTASSVPAYGNLQLRVKAYTSTETFNVQTWNYTSAGWDGNRISITALSNTWYSYDLVEADHRSLQTVKVRIVDGTDYTADTTQDLAYLDVAWVSHYHANPTMSEDGCNPTTAYKGTTIHFWVKVTDADNELPSATYPKVWIEGSTYIMTENNSGDLDTYDSKAYFYDKSDFIQGEYDFYFITKDANSPEVTSTTKQFTIENRAPTITNPLGDQTEYTDTYWEWDYAATDPDSDTITWDHSSNASWLTINTGSGLLYGTTPAMASSYWVYVWANDSYGDSDSDTFTFYVQVLTNNPPTLTGFGRTPADPVYVTTELNFTVTYTDAENEAPTFIKWREDGGSTQNLTMSKVDPGDVTYTDGVQYYIELYLGHGTHNYDYATSDGTTFVSGGSNSVNIQNRAPTIDNKIGDQTTYRNTYWEYDYTYTDLDGDIVVFDLSSNASFLNINTATGLVYGTTSNPVGWYDVTVWCNDSYSGSDFDYFKLYVNNRAPIITSSGNTTQMNDTFLSYHVTSTDADGDTVTYELSTNASWAAIENGWVNGTTPVLPGWFTFSVWANDSYGGSDLEEWTLTVTTPPTEPEVTEIRLGFGLIIFFAVLAGVIAWALVGVRG